MPLQGGTIGCLTSSALGRFRARVTAALTAREFAPSCAHTDDAYWLYMPSAVLICRGCKAARGAGEPDSQPGPCAACGAPDARGRTGWIHQEPVTAVVARVCEGCLRGSVRQSWN